MMKVRFAAKPPGDACPLRTNSLAEDPLAWRRRFLDAGTSQKYGGLSE